MSRLCANVSAESVPPSAAAVSAAAAAVSASEAVSAVSAVSAAAAARAGRSSTRSGVLSARRLRHGTVLLANVEQQARWRPGQDRSHLQWAPLGAVGAAACASEGGICKH